MVLRQIIFLKEEFKKKNKKEEKENSKGIPLPWSLPRRGQSFLWLHSCPQTLGHNPGSRAWQRSSIILTEAALRPVDVAKAESKPRA